VARSSRTAPQHARNLPCDDHLVFERMTADVRAVIADMPRHARAANHSEMTLWDLASALAEPVGNTAGLWPPAESRPAGATPPAGPYLRFDREVRAVLAQSLAVAQRQRATHVGTEHLLAALVHTGPSDVVAWLGTRGATTEAVDALLARLGGGLGVERLPDVASRTDQRRWRQATGGRRTPRPLAVLAAILAVVLVFAFCVWGP